MKKHVIKFVSDIDMKDNYGTFCTFDHDFGTLNERTKIIVHTVSCIDKKHFIKFNLIWQKKIHKKGEILPKTVSLHLSVMLSVFQIQSQFKKNNCILTLKV